MRELITTLQSVRTWLKIHHAEETVDFSHHADNKSEGERALSKMWRGGKEKKKVVLADEKGAWRKRTLHLKRASVNTEIEKMEQRERGEGRYEWEQFVSAELCSLRDWRIPFISMTGLKQQGETGETP